MRQSLPEVCSVQLSVGSKKLALCCNIVGLDARSASVLRGETTERKDSWTRCNHVCALIGFLRVVRVWESIPAHVS